MNIFFILLFCLFYPLQEVKNAHVTFKISHMSVLSVEGNFEEIDVSISRESKHVWIAKGAVVAGSIQTGNTSRDETILTEQYLNVEAYPAMPFEAEIKRNKEEILMTVNLQIRGIPVTLNSTLELQNGEFVSKPIIISREEIGLDFGAMDSLIGDEIELVIHTQIVVEDLLKLEK